MSLSSVQALAAQTLSYVSSGKNLTDTLTNILIDHPELTPQDKGMLQDIAYGCQRFQGSLRFMLSKMLTKPIDHPILEHYLLLALYQLHHTQNAPHAVVNEAINHIAKIGHGQYRSFANAILRRFLREREQLSAKLKKNSAKHNLPQWWITYLQHHYPQHWHNISSAFLQHPPLTLRINCRRTNANKYLQLLNQQGIDAKKLSDYAIMLDQPIPVHQLPEFEQGSVSVQDWGAQQAALILDVQNGERVLDACAAPGGKTGHILETADCELVALDIDATRLSRVADNLTRLHLSAELHVSPAQNLENWYRGVPFDAVLADIPCTASGTLKRNPDIKWQRRPSDARNTAAQQEPLLDALWSVVKPGGRMLLATCSLFEEENQEQCHRFLKKHSNAQLKQETLLLPNKQQDGFYYALLHKSVA